MPILIARGFFVNLFSSRRKGFARETVIEFTSLCSNARINFLFFAKFLQKTKNAFFQKTITFKFPNIHNCFWVVEGWPTLPLKRVWSEESPPTRNKKQVARATPGEQKRYPGWTVKGFAVNETRPRLTFSPQGENGVQRLRAAETNAGNPIRKKRANNRRLTLHCPHFFFFLRKKENLY